MQAASIKTQSQPAQYPQNAPQESPKTLFDEFSKTLDEIASKVHRQEASELENNGPAGSDGERPKIKVKTEKDPLEKAQKSAEKALRSEQKAEQKSEKKDEKKAEKKDEAEHDIRCGNDEKVKKAPHERASDEAGKSEKECKNEEETSKLPESADDDDVSAADPVETARAAAETLTDAASAPVPPAPEDKPANEGEGEDAASEENPEAAPQPDIPLSEEAQALPAETAPPDTARAPGEKPALETGELKDTAAIDAPPAENTEDAQPKPGEQPNAAGQPVEADIAAAAALPVSAARHESPAPAQKSSQELLAQTLEKLIQNKLLEASIPDASSEQRNSAALVAQRAQTVLSLLSQGVKGTGLKPDFNPSPQAHALQISDMGVSKEADSSLGESTKGGAGLTKPQALRTMERVETALKEVSKAKDGKTISVRLDPPELGTVKVDVSYKEGSLHARIAAEQGNVVHLLKERTHELVAMIRKLGLNVEKVTVTVTSSGGQNAETLSGFESFKQGSGNQGSKNGRRFGVEHGAGESVTRRETVDDHWIA